MIQWFSNLLGKAVMASNTNPLPLIVVAAPAVPFNPGAPISEINPLPITIS